MENIILNEQNARYKMVEEDKAFYTLIHIFKKKRLLWGFTKWEEINCFKYQMTERFRTEIGLFYFNTLEEGDKVLRTLKITATDTIFFNPHAHFINSKP